MPLPDPTELTRRLADHPPQAAPPDTRQAAVAVTLRWSPTPEVLLMQRRARTGDPWSGQVSFPGGHREPDDADLIHTARREAHEELGIDLATAATPLGQLPPTQAMARGKRLDLWITPVLFHAHAELAPAPSAEAEAAFWLPLTDARAGAFDHRFRYTDEKRTLILPAWRFQERIIWGLTFRMLTGMLDALGPTPP